MQPKASPEAAFWHAMLSASGICLAIVGFILSAYGTALGKELSDYYGYLEDRESRPDNSVYKGWIVAAPVLCLICNFFLGMFYYKVKLLYSDSSIVKFQKSNFVPNVIQSNQIPSQQIHNHFTIIS